MSHAGRGPSGAAQLPPAWLPRTSLPLVTFPAGSPFFRIHRSTNPPLFFSPGAGQAPSGRFDSVRGGFGVLYAAEDFAGAFAETVLRNPARQLVSMSEIAGRSVASLVAARPLRLVQLRGSGLQRLGVDNAITTGPYGPCGAWADALFDHPDAPDGIAYASRHDPRLLCVALFSRPDIGLTQPRQSIRLADMADAVGAVLRHYGKGLDG